LLALLGPLLGAALVHWLHWRATLAAVALFGAVALAGVAWQLTETLPRRNPRATALSHVAANWKRILRHPTFVAWTALQCASWGGLFTMLASSSFIFIDVLGASQLGYGAVLAACSLSYIIGTLLCRLLLRHGNASQAVAIGAVFSLSGGALLAGLSLAGVHSMWAIVPPLLLYGLGHGIHQPCSNAGAISPFPDAAGTAASLSGFALMATAFAVGLALGRGMNGTVYPLTLGIGAFSVCIAVVAWTLVRRHGDRRVLAPSAQPA
jgi:DHA1 family bicyclomycin/chloramphenicol resistance-like MFS transporter